MITVTPLKSFDHNGTRRKGVPFECSEPTANALKRCKLVSFGEVLDSNPSEPAAPSSASLPAPALPQTIAKQLESGDVKVTTKLKKKPGRKKKSLL